MRKLRFVAAAVLICSWACAGGDAPEPSDSSGARPLPSSEHPRAASSATAKLADDPDAEVVSGGEQDPTTEGSNTNWMPTEPWLDGQRPQARERPDPRKPAGGPPSNTESPPDQGQSSTRPGQQGESSSSGSSSGSSESTPGPD